MKSILKDLIPPIFVRSYRRVASQYGFFGEYPTWEDALKDSSGYGSELILEKVKDALLKVKNGDAVYERDSVLFDKIEYSWPVLAGLMWIASQNNNSLNLIDYGGSLGSTYFQNRKFLENLQELQWNIIEQARFVECGKLYFEDEHLKFYKNMDDCIKDQHPETIVLSSVLPYLERPYALLQDVLNLNFTYIIVDRTPFLAKGKDRLTVQKVSPAIYEASYPVWFLSEMKFLDFLKNDYELVVDFDALAGQIKLEDTIANDKGFIFRNRRK